MDESSSVQRLGKNHDAYYGERIDIQTVLREVATAAQEYGWAAETFLDQDGFKLSALTRKVTKGAGRAPRIYISTGIHGDEPAGPLAAGQLLRENLWPAEADIWLCPCLNPTGFVDNRRENAKGIDLNRQYLKPDAAETLAHIAWLERQPDFDVCLCLHEDWESAGFYLYELNPDGRHSFAKPIVQAVEGVCPIDMSAEIEGRPAVAGIINPSVDPRSRPDWPEAFYLLTHKTRLSYTLEAPSDFPLGARVAALVAGVNAVLGNLQLLKSTA